MSKYIKAEVLKNNIHKLVWTQDMKSVEKFVDSLPAADVVEKEKYDRLLENSLIVSSALQKYQKADVEEVRHGRWEDSRRLDFGGIYHWFRQCSECLYEREDYTPEKDTNYCPNCGAKMDGDTE